MLRAEVAHGVGNWGWEGGGMPLKLRKRSGLPAPKAQASCLLEKGPQPRYILFSGWAGLCL